MRIDQATPGAGVANRSRHDLIPGEVITLTAVDPAPGPGTTFTWEIIDVRGSSSGLSASTGTSVTIDATATRPFAFLIQLTAETSTGTTVTRRIASCRTSRTSLRVPVYPETAPETGTLDVHDADDSTDNAIYANRSGTGATQQNWTGWAEWAWELVQQIETLAGSITPYPVSSTYTVASGVSVGDVVYITGADAAAKADNTALATANAIPGIVVEKPTTTTAIVALAGELDLFSSLTPGAIYYLGTSGGLTATPPTAALTVVRRIGVAKNATTLSMSVGDPVVM